MNKSAVYDPDTYQPSDDQAAQNYAHALSEYPAQAIIDMSALQRNMRTIVDFVNTTSSADHRVEVMGMVKADAYGHGLIPTALAALQGGCTWLGTAQPREALQLRKAGISADRCKILTWVYDSQHLLGKDLIEHQIDIGVGSPQGLRACIEASKQAGRPCRIHIKIDTGFGRNGFTLQGLYDILPELSRAVSSGYISLEGAFSHLSVADEPDNPEAVDFTKRQILSFEEALHCLHDKGFNAFIAHLANTAGALLYPEIYYDLVRPGVALYGCEPSKAVSERSHLHLQQAMTLQAQLGTVKTMQAGQALSYGRTYIMPEESSTAIIPIGYADGIHRSASGSNRAGALHLDKAGGPVRIRTNQGYRIVHVSGRVCMDQFVVDLQGKAEDLDINESDTVILFGARTQAANSLTPTADDWAVCADTINYEIFTCLRNRIPRLYWRADSVLSPSDLAMLDPTTLI